jgi:hypothetical protein
MQNRSSNNHEKTTLGNVALWKLLVVVRFWLNFVHLETVLNSLQTNPLLYPDTVKVKSIQ